MVTRVERFIDQRVDLMVAGTDETDSGRASLSNARVKMSTGSTLLSRDSMSRRRPSDRARRAIRTGKRLHGSSTPGGPRVGLVPDRTQREQKGNTFFGYESDRIPLSRENVRFSTIFQRDGESKNLVRLRTEKEHKSSAVRPGLRARRRGWRASRPRPGRKGRGRRGRWRGGRGGLRPARRPD